MTRKKKDRPSPTNTGQNSPPSSIHDRWKRPGDGTGRDGTGFPVVYGNYDASNPPEPPKVLTESVRGLSGTMDPNPHEFSNRRPRPRRGSVGTGPQRTPGVGSRATSSGL